MKDVNPVYVKDSASGDYAEVTNDNELHVCLCKKTCKGAISMEALLKRYPGLHISIRKEQLKGDSNAKPHNGGTQAK